MWQTKTSSDKEFNKVCPVNFSGPPLYSILGLKAIISFLPNLNINTDGGAYEMKAKCQRRPLASEKITNQSAQQYSIISKYELNDNSTHRIFKFLQKGNIELGTRVSLLSDKSLKRRKTNLVLYQQLFQLIM